MIISEWSMVGVIITIIGLVATIVTPMLKLNATITKLTTIVTHIEKNIESFTTKNTQSHARIWEHNDAQDDVIQNHETRITVLEKKG